MGGSQWDYSKVLLSTGQKEIDDAWADLLQMLNEEGAREAVLFTNEGEGMEELGHQHGLAQLREKSQNQTSQEYLISLQERNRAKVEKKNENEIDLYMFFESNPNPDLSQKASELTKSYPHLIIPMRDKVGDPLSVQARTQKIEALYEEHLQVQKSLETMKAEEQKLIEQMNKKFEEALANGELIPRKEWERKLASSELSEEESEAAIRRDQDRFDEAEKVAILESQLRERKITKEQFDSQKKQLLKQRIDGDTFALVQKIITNKMDEKLDIMGAEVLQSQFLHDAEMAAERWWSGRDPKTGEKLEGIEGAEFDSREGITSFQDKVDEIARSGVLQIAGLDSALSTEMLQQLYYDAAKAQRRLEQAKQVIENDAFALDYIAGIPRPEGVSVFLPSIKGMVRTTYKSWMPNRQEFEDKCHQYEQDRQDINANLKANESLHARLQTLEKGDKQIAAVEKEIQHNKDSIQEAQESMGELLTELTALGKTIFGDSFVFEPDSVAADYDYKKVAFTSGLRDLSRGTVKVPNINDIKPAAKYFFETLKITYRGATVQRFKNKFRDMANGSDTSGYADVQVHFAVDGGHICEMQFNCEALLRFKSAKDENWQTLLKRTDELVAAREALLPTHLTDEMIAEANADEKTVKAIQQFRNSDWNLNAHIIYEITRWMETSTVDEEIKSAVLSSLNNLSRAASKAFQQEFGEHDIQRLAEWKKWDD